MRFDHQLLTVLAAILLGMTFQMALQAVFEHRHRRSKTMLSTFHARRSLASQIRLEAVNMKEEDARILLAAASALERLAVTDETQVEELRKLGYELRKID